MTHALKTWPEYYKAIESGERTFEIRRFDRPFKVGDKLLLQEYDSKADKYTGKEMTMIITYILSGNINKFGLYSDFCVMSIKELDY